MSKVMNTADLTTAHPTNAAGPSAVNIRSFQPGTADAKAFRSLNEEWITSFFTMEARDFEILGDPEGSILKHGGHIYMACLGPEAVGCVALERMDGDVYELSKMAVTPHLRGQGVGRRLLEYAIEQARALGAKSLFLGSNTKLENAVHLYESVGFEHLPPERIPDVRYARPNVFMEKNLK
jgi:GNAT superfamily N-acetyltransferase